MYFRFWNNTVGITKLIHVDFFFNASVLLDRTLSLSLSE